eukprot:4835993-Lingulodinium_polyedra.AAC.1
MARACCARARAAFRRADVAKRTFNLIVAQLWTNAAQRCARTRAPPLQRGNTRHARTRHARNM